MGEKGANDCGELQRREIEELIAALGPTIDVPVGLGKSGRYGRIIIASDD